MLKKFFENVNRQTAPLTLVLSRRGREEMKKYPLTLALSHVWLCRKPIENKLI
jgi:hypothetical protein